MLQVINMVLQYLLVGTLWIFSIVSSDVIELTCEQKRSFIDGHNQRRLSLAQGKVPGQPGAEKMNFMVWDEELATKASQWAANYDFNHNPDRNVPSNRFVVGENIYWYGTTDLEYELDVDKALTGWWDEYKDFKYKKLNLATFSQAKQVGHYTQMAWAETNYVGCAMSTVNKNNWQNFYVICNYGPAGNYLGEYPYKQGESTDLVCDIPDCSKMYGDICPDT